MLGSLYDPILFTYLILHAVLTFDQLFTYPTVIAVDDEVVMIATVRAVSV